MKKILHITFTALVFLSATGVFLGEHHCKMQEQKIAEGIEVSCKDTGGCQKGCCSTEYSYFKNDQDFQVQEFDFKQLKKPEFAKAIIPSSVLSLSETEFENLTFLTYKPPILQRDIPVLFQSFLL